MMNAPARHAPHLSIVALPPAQGSFIGARQDMLRAWRRVIETGVDAELLLEEIAGTANAMRQLLGLARG